MRNVNDGTSQPPRVAHYLNMGTLGDLPAWSAGPRGDERACLEAVREAGYEGVQGGDAGLAHELGLKYAGGGRVNAPGEPDELARALVDQGAVCGTLHVAWGMEDDATIDRLVDDVLEASAKHEMPLYIETHRATITQDSFRTKQLVQRKPDVRFNGDFSHWYTGHEMPYGGVDEKIEFLAPVFDRVRFMHGRIGNPSHMQVNVGDSRAEAEQRENVQHYEKLWTRAMAGFAKSAAAGDVLIFAPELLPPKIWYARTFPGPDGEPREESDRWQQAKILCELIDAWWTKAQA